MRLIAGAIFVLAASVLAAAWWLGQIHHQPTLAGSPESWYLLLAASLIGLFGLIVAALGIVGDRMFESFSRDRLAKTSGDHDR